MVDIKAVIKTILSQFLEALFPKKCLVCSGMTEFHSDIICKTCCCKIEIADMEILNNIKVHAFFEYDQAISKAVFGIKYLQRPGYVRKIFNQKKDEFTLELPAESILLPVPLHSIRKRERGYNQAALLATLFAEYFGVSINETILFRKRNTGTQTKLNSEQRQQNMKNVFTAILDSELDGKTLFIVDDVYTTGATMESCVMALRNAGYENEISFLTFAKAVKNNDTSDFQMLLSNVGEITLQ